MPRNRLLPLATIALGALIASSPPDLASAASPNSVDAGLLYRSTQIGEGARAAGRIDVFAPDGSGRRTILRSARGTVFGQLQVSADGRLLAYVESAILPSGNRRVTLKVVPTTGGTPRTLDAGRFATQRLALSPDGLTVYYAKFRPSSPNVIRDADYRRSEIYAVAVAGGPVRRLTRDRIDDYGPTAGPDGRIYWTRDTRGRSGTDVWSMAPDGTDRRRLEHTPIHLETTDVAADGRLLVSRTAPDSERSQLATVAPDGTGLTTLGPLTVRGWPTASWSPDLQRIVALRAVGPVEDGRYGIVRINVATGAITRVFDPRPGEATLSVDWATTPDR